MLPNLRRWLTTSSRVIKCLIHLLHDLLFLNTLMTFLHCNLDGSLSRRVTPYLEVNFDLVLDRSDLPDSLSSYNRMLWISTKLLSFSLINFCVKFTNSPTQLLSFSLINLCVKYINSPAPQTTPYPPYPPSPQHLY